MFDRKRLHYSIRIFKCYTDNIIRKMGRTFKRITAAKATKIFGVTIHTD